MNRKEFIRTCGFSCLAIAGLAPILQSCTGVKQIQLPVSNQFVEIEDMEFAKEKPGTYRRMISVKTESLNYPILVYRFSENKYKAFLLQCPHQNAELSVHGDIISCSAHGSEFNNKGEVIQGPAESNLIQYKVDLSSTKLRIKIS